MALTWTWVNDIEGWFYKGEGGEKQAHKQVACCKVYHEPGKVGILNLVGIE